MRAPHANPGRRRRSTCLKTCRELRLAAKERGTSEAELIRTAVRHELLGAPAGQAERATRRARLLAAIGASDQRAYPPGYLEELHSGWRS